MRGNGRIRFDGRRTFRHAPTEAERILWEAIRDRQVCGLKFRRQHPVKPYVLDFYCSKAHLALEVDGDVHDHEQDADAARTAYLEELGYHVLRFRNEEILYRLDKVLQRIASVATHTDHKPRRRVPPPSPCEAAAGYPLAGDGEGGGLRGRVR